MNKKIYYLLLLLLVYAESSYSIIIKTGKSSFSYTDNESGKIQNVELENLLGDIEYVAVTRHSNQALSSLNIFIIRSGDYFYIAYEGTIVSVEAAYKPTTIGLSLLPEAKIGVYGEGMAFFLVQPQVKGACCTTGSTVYHPLSGTQLEKVDESTYLINPDGGRPSHNLFPFEGSLQIIEFIEFGN